MRIRVNTGPTSLTELGRYRTSDGNAEARSPQPGIRMDDDAEGMAVVRSGGSAVETAETTKS